MPKQAADVFLPDSPL